MSFESQKLKPRYFGQIDALRAIAVTMVIFSHWAGYHQDMWKDDVFWFNGEVGVKMFFIISGFLITGILLDEREKSTALNTNKSTVLKNFYIRRFLRIFPVYYATLFVTFALGHDDVRQSIKWHLTYLSNVYFALKGGYLGDVSHFWSLAVEEQFYLVWPLLILFLPKRLMLPFIITAIFIAPVFRFIAEFMLGANDVTVTVLPVSALDCLGSGALLAFLKSKLADNMDRRSIFNILKTICIISFVGWMAIRIFKIFPPDLYAYKIFLSRMLLVPALLGVVWLCVDGIGGVTGKILNFPPLVYLGRISYGVYIFHFFIPGATYWLCYKFDILIWQEAGMVAFLVLNTIILISLASLSWHVLESPLNSLKKYFPYAQPVIKGSWSAFLYRFVPWK
jgi:peptidoglycan/LPS O-acetylase OafA/YrhL